MSNQQIIQVPCPGCGCQSGGVPNPGCCDPTTQNMPGSVTAVVSGFEDCPFCFSTHGSTTEIHDHWDWKIDLSAINGSWQVPNFQGSCSYQVRIPGVVPIHTKRRFLADRAPCNNAVLNQTIMQDLVLRYDVLTFGGSPRRFVTMSVGGQGLVDPEPKDRLGLFVYCGVIFGPRTVCVGTDTFPPLPNGCVNPGDPVLGYFPTVPSTNICPLPSGQPAGPWFGGGQVTVIRAFGGGGEGIGEEDI